MIHAPRRRRVAGLCRDIFRDICMAVLLTGHAFAADVLNIDVEQAGSRYAVEAEARFDVPAARLRALLTDYTHLDRINDAIRRSEVLAMTGPQQHRIRTEAWVCVGPFCKDIVQIQDVEVLAGGDILATLRPEGSNFRYGRAHWQFSTAPDGTRMHFRSEIEPAFWVPPFIGPWLIKRALQAEALKSVANLERLAEE